MENGNLLLAASLLIGIIDICHQMIQLVKLAKDEVHEKLKNSEAKKILRKTK